MGLLLVLNIHGSINSAAPVRRAMAELKVSKKFTASVVTDDQPTVGMLKLCKDYVAWSALDPELLGKLLEVRGTVSSSKSLDSASLKRMGYKSHKELASAMVSKDLRLSAVDGVRPFFNLAPPKGGFKRSARRQFTQGGILGNNPNLAELVGRMV